MEPVYLSVKQAAKIFNIGENTLRDYLNARDHPPYLLVGKAKKVRRDALEQWFKSKEIR